MSRLTERTALRGSLEKRQGLVSWSWEGGPGLEDGGDSLSRWAGRGESNQASGEVVGRLVGAKKRG